MPKRILITGGSGLLALNWAVFKRSECEVCLVTHKHTVKLDGVTVRNVSLEEPHALLCLLDEWGADLVVHTAGMTNVDQCEQHPKLAQLANVALAGNVAEAACRYGAQLIHISTDHIFAGDTALANEECVPDPHNVYAQTKLEGERAAIAAHPNALVVRTNFYGWGHRFRTSFSDWVIGTLRRGERIKLFHDTWFTPVLIDHLVRVAHDLSDIGTAGVINLTGDERISKYKFAMQLAEVFSLDTGLIECVSSEDVPLVALRPKDLSLSNALAQRLLGRNIGGLSDGFCDLLAQERAGRRDELLAAVST